MTGGRVVVLGATGHNFAAGMSGGIAYVLDSEGRFASRCNRDLVGLGRIEDPGEADEVRSLIEEHRDRTGSALAREMLGDWDATLQCLVRVMPHDYERALHDDEADDDSRSRAPSRTRAVAHGPEDRERKGA
jgi:glutamate synthase domain-containing protein 3